MLVGCGYEVQFQVNVKCLGIWKNIMSIDVYSEYKKIVKKAAQRLKFWVYKTCLDIRWHHY